MKYIRTIGLLTAVVAATFTVAASADNQMPNEQQRQQFRHLLEQHSHSWMIRYGNDGSVYVLLIEQVDPQVACDLENQVEGIDVKQATVYKGETVQC